MRISKKKQCRRAYADAVFIHFAEQHPHMSVANYPDSFETELDIVNNVTYAKRLAYKKLIFRNKFGGYSATDEGRQLIDPFYIEFYEFCCPYADIYDFEQERKRDPEQSFCAVMWSVLLQELRRRMKNGEFSAVCNLHRDIALLYEREQYMERAAYHFVAALYIHYSGLPYYDDLLKLIRGKKSEKTVRGLCSRIYPPPLIAEGLKRHRDRMTQELVDQVFRSIPLSINLCSSEMLYQLIQDIVAGAYNDEQWQDRLTAAYGRLVENAKSKRGNRRVKALPASERDYPR